MRPIVAVVLLSSAGSAGGLGLSAQRVDTVRVGSSSLRGTLPELGTTTVESFRRQHGVDTPTSMTIQRVSLATWGDLEVLLIATDHLGPDGDSTRSRIVARATDLSLLHHRVRAQRDSASVSVTNGSLTGWVVLPDEPTELLDLPLSRRVFPLEGQIPWLFPLLPLADGYAAAIPRFSEWQADEEWSSIRVVGSERIESSGEARDCWRVDGGELFPGFGVTYWVDKLSRRVLLGVARGSEDGPEFWSRLTTFAPAF